MSEPIEKIEEAWEHYKRCETPAEIASETGVPHDTIVKWISEGCPEHGWPSLREKLEKLNARMKGDDK